MHPGPGPGLPWPRGPLCTAPMPNTVAFSAKGGPVGEDYIAFFSTLLGSDWQALFVLAVAVVPPGSPWGTWEVARERAILVAEDQRPDLSWTAERRALVRGAWVAWQRAEHASAA